MVNITPDEVSNIIRQQIETYEQSIQLNDVGKVLRLEMVLLVFSVLNRLWRENF